MAEYIERKVVINRIKEYTLDVYDLDLDDAKQFGGNSRIENYCEGLYEATELVDEIPAANVAPVQHAKWEIVVGSNGKEYMVCTGCRKQQDLTGVFSYCPNCGAKMDLEDT